MKTRRFDAASYLDTEKRQAAYIAAALETGDAECAMPLALSRGRAA